MVPFRVALRKRLEEARAFHATHGGQEEDHIEIRSKGGVYVAQPHVATDLKSAGIGPFEAIDSRLLIEPEVAAITASKVTDGLLAELAACIAQMRQAHAQGHEADAGDHRSMSRSPRRPAMGCSSLSAISSGAPN
jgi:DNA-binding FadR family transcriptional regulator